MQARRLPAARGVFWLFEGFRLFRRNPPLITALTLAYLLAVQLLAFLLPGIGPVLLPVVLPVLTLVVANGCRSVDEGRLLGKAALLSGIMGNGPALLRLGLLQLAGTVVLMLLGLAFGDGLDPLAGLESGAGIPGMATEGGASPDPAAEAAMLGAMLRALLLAAPLVIAFWFTPFLTGWDRVAPLKAVFFSTVASWRNWSALLMFGVAVVALAGILPGFLLIALGQIAGMAVNVAFIALRMLLVFLVMPVLMASIYVSYRDIFRAEG